MITGEQQKAIDKAQNAVDSNPVDSEGYVELGMAYFEAAQFDEAIAAFHHALALNPIAAKAYNGIGRVHYHTGPAHAAIEAYERAIALDRHYIDAYYGLGILYSAKLGQYESALETFQRGLEHNPTEAFLLASLGSTYARMGRFEEALVSLQQAVDLQPDNAFAYSWLSIIYLHLEQYEKAMVACQREIEVAESASARRVLGYIHSELGRYEEALAQLERSVALQPDDYEARGALATVYRSVDRSQDAQEQYAIASEMAAQDDEYGQACFAAVSGNLEEALRLLKVALRNKQVQPGWVRIDPEFAFVKEDLRFKALLDG